MIDERLTEGEMLSRRLAEIGNSLELDAARVAYREWGDYNRTLLKRLFEGPILREYDVNAPFILFDTPTLGEELRNLVRDADGELGRLRSIRGRLHLWAPEFDLEPVVMVQGPDPEVDPDEPTEIGPIFIVHGRDEAPKHEIARFLEQLGLEAVILHERTSRGKTLVEKLEHYGRQAGYAVVILSPDDEGRFSDEQADLEPRARQNVIFEMGYFIGLLGRERVSAVLQSDLRQPSDINGVVYVEWAGDWKLQLTSELREAGYEIDMNQLGNG